MEFDFEPLTDQTLDEAVSFMRAANPFAQLTWGWDTGRFIDFRWGFNAIREANSPGWFARHCSITRRDGAIAALAIAEDGGADHCVITATDDAELVAEVLDGVLQRHGDPRFPISDRAEWLHPVLAGRGFDAEPGAGVEWEYDLEHRDEPPAVVPGFTVDGLSVDRESDYAGISTCLQRAFGSDGDARPVLRSLEANPMFEPDLSIVARAPDGRIAAYCRGTVDAENGVCGIDPVATDPEFQGRGLGKAVVRACLTRQRRMGGRRSFIGSAPEPAPGTYLYRSLGPAEMATFSGWSLPGSH
jgi:ribosomal protein S18 acetylase RimI-like enzyme